MACFLLDYAGFAWRNSHVSAAPVVAFSTGGLDEPRAEIGKALVIAPACTLRIVWRGGDSMPGSFDA